MAATAPNPEAIAWYLAKSENLLKELREEILALRTRGGQTAGFSGAVLALAGSNAESILAALHGLARDCVGASLLIGCALLIVSLVAALRGTVLPQLVSGVSAKEIANYDSARFTHEPDLWRVHIRAIHGLSTSMELMSRQSDEAARRVRKAERFFFVSLSAVGVAFGILIVVVTL